MAQFIPFAPNVQVNGQTVLSVVNAIQFGQDFRISLLEKHGLKNVVPDEWYPQEAWLNAFKEIADTIGDKTLFTIGKAIPENAKFPPEINSLEIALQAINQAYQMNHKGGKIGHYKLVSFDAETKKATMECMNPYPSEFDRGIIMTMLRRFKPKDSLQYDVVLATSLPTRLAGAESCTYLINW